MGRHGLGRGRGALPWLVRVVCAVAGPLRLTIPRCTGVAEGWLPAILLPRVLAPVAVKVVVGPHGGVPTRAPARRAPSMPIRRVAVATPIAELETGRRQSRVAAPPRAVARTLRRPPRPVATTAKRTEVMSGAGTHVVEERSEASVGEATTPEVARDGRLRQGPTTCVVAFATERVVVAVALPPLPEASAVALETPQVPVAVAARVRAGVLAARGAQGPTPVVGQSLGVPTRGRPRPPPVRPRVRRGVVLTGAEGPTITGRLVRRLLLLQLGAQVRMGPLETWLPTPTLPPPNVDLPLGAETSSTVGTTYGPGAPGLPPGAQTVAGPIARVPAVRHVGRRRVAL